MNSMAAQSSGPTLSIGRIERHLRDGQRHSLIEIVECELWPGNAYALVGESGIGKTTTLEMLALAQQPDKMERFAFRHDARLVDLVDLLVAGEREALSEVRARHFGYITQSSRLLPFLNVRENIEVAQRIAGRRDPSLVARLLEALELVPLARVLPSALSGGQRQRVCVARALAHRPAVVLADEPTSAVDAVMGRLIMRMIRAHAAETGAVALVITHNLGLAREFELKQLAIESRSTASGMHTTVSSPHRTVPSHEADALAAQA
jgi:putative ABC transport system ATP-binding protein